MSIQAETDKIMELNSHGPNGLQGYSFPTYLNEPELIELLIQKINNGPLALSKNFKMEHYFPVMELMVNQVNKIYFSPEQNQTKIKKMDMILYNLLFKITGMLKGQILLKKLSHRFGKVTNQNEIILNLLLEAARGGPFVTFL